MCSSDLKYSDIVKEKIKEIIKNDELTEKEINKILRYSIKEALEQTEDETYQGCESLIHNLNSMNSRAGSQVPFSSVNLGTDTSYEGRMLIKNFLLSQERGLGNGETSIFPISIFKVKEGINYNPEDPNYDLFKLAMRCSSKRMFPNFEFIDAPFNLQYYKNGDINTEIATMGCVDGKETSIYKDKDKILFLSFEDAWDYFKNKYQVFQKDSDKCSWIDLKNIKIYDGSTCNFVDCYRIIRNHYKDGLKIVTKNGRVLSLTEDHPLEVKDKGRIEAINIKIGDKIQISTKSENLSSSREYNNNDILKAWSLGLLVCDGCYQSSVTVSLGNDEEDIGNSFVKSIKNLYDLDVNVVKRSRGLKGKYIDYIVLGEQKNIREELLNTFKHYNKKDRRVPFDIFNWNIEE